MFYQGVPLTIQTPKAEGATRHSFEFEIMILMLLMNFCLLFYVSEI
jgi:hypothetical protein